jgi:hypothetical protein
MIRALVVLLAGALASAQTLAASNTYKDGATSEFFQSLKTPGNGWSCCDQSDCDVVHADCIDGRWVAVTRLGQPGEVVAVPQETVLKDKVSPFQIDGIGLAILCEARTGNAEAKPVTGSMGTTFVIYCFVIPPTFG